MRDLNEKTLTDEAIRAVSQGGDVRTTEISGALVRHLHAFVKEIEPSQAEWEVAIGFLTRTGQMCNDRRQEFILLSDALGVSMLVDAINHRQPSGATDTTVFGPFFVKERPVLPLGADMSPDETGMRMYVSGSVRDTRGRAIPGAAVDSWHSDEEGFYDVQQGEDLSGRGCFRCDEEGRFWFWSVRPKFYPIPDDGPVGDMLKAQGRHPYRPEHVHFLIAAHGYRTLVTHVFIEDDPYLESDVVFGVKSSLVTSYQLHEPGIAPDGTHVDQPFVVLEYDFVLADE